MRHMPRPARVKAGTFLLLAFLPLFLAACNASVIDPNLKATVTITILDASTELAVDKALISFVGGSKKRTGTNGQATFEDVRAGNYFIRIEKAGYESAIAPLNVVTNGTQTVVAVNVSRVFPLNRRGATVTGRVLMQPQQNPDLSATMPASAVTVELRAYSSFFEDDDYYTAFANPLRTTTTTASGYYSFDSLPELAYYEIRVPQFSVGNKTYGPATPPAPTETLFAGEQYVAPNVTLTPGSGNLQAFARSTNLTKGSPLQIEFTGSVDTSRLIPSSIRLSRFPGDVTIAPSLTWSQNFTLLSVRPYQSDWTDGVFYTVTLNAIQDVLNRALNPDPTIIPASVPVIIPLTQVQNLRIRATTAIRGVGVDTTIVDFATTPYRFSWNQVLGAEGYSLYSREGLDSAWVLRSSTFTSDDTTLNIAQTAPFPVKQWTRYFMVLPNSSTQTVPYSLGALRTVTDAVKPSLNVSTSSVQDTTGTATFVNATNGIKTVVLKVNLLLTGGQIDPLDTNTHPALRVGEGKVGGGMGDSTYAPSISFKWTSRTTGHVNVIIAPLEDARRDTVVLTFLQVKDLAGNVFDTLPAQPILKLPLMQ